MTEPHEIEIQGASGGTQVANDYEHGSEKPREWPSARLRDHVDFLAGYAFKSKHYEELGTGPALVRGANVSPGRIDWDRKASWPENQLDGLDEYFLDAGDVILAMDRPWIPAGLKLAQMSSLDLPALLVQRVARMRGSDSLDGGFLYHALRTWDFTSHILGVQTGTTVPHISARQILSFQFPLPPLIQQRRIAAVLGALDDKIDLNRRMNRTLEATAQALFHERFVAPLAHLGDGAEAVPDGWKLGSLGDAVEILDRLRVPLSKMERSKRTGPYPYHGATSVMDTVDDYLFEGIHVLVGEDGSVKDEMDRPVLQYVWGKFWVNNHAHVLRAKPPLSNEHLLLALRNSNVNPFITGAVQPKLNQRNLKRIPITLPSVEACISFNRSIAPIYSRFRANVEQSAALAEMRDALLP